MAKELIPLLRIDALIWGGMPASERRGKFTVEKEDEVRDNISKNKDAILKALGEFEAAVDEATKAGLDYTSSKYTAKVIETTKGMVDKKQPYIAALDVSTATGGILSQYIRTHRATEEPAKLLYKAWSKDGADLTTMLEIAGDIDAGASGVMPGGRRKKNRKTTRKGGRKSRKVTRRRR